MRLLFLTHQGDVAGSTLSINYLILGLVRRNHKVWVGCRKHSMLYEMLQAHALDGLYVEPMTFAGRLDYANAKHIKRLVQRHQVSIICAQSSYDRYTSMLAKWLFKLPVKIVHVRRQIPLSTGIIFQNWLYKRFVDRIVTVSTQVRDALLELGVIPQLISVIHNGIPPEKYVNKNISVRAQQLRKELGIAANDVVLGVVARIKKHDQLLRATQSLPKHWIVLFVGIEEVPALQRLRQQLKLSQRIIYTGIVSNHTALAYMQLLHIKILPSTSEGLSQSLLEAMGMGIPVVATAAAGNLDVIQHETNGLLFQDGDIDALRKSIERLVYDVDLRKKLVLEGQETVKNFSVDHTILRYEALFQELTTSKDKAHESVVGTS